MTEKLVTEISHINFIMDDEDLDFWGVEFETAEDIGDEFESSLFQFRVDKETGEKEIYCAYSEDYAVMEEVEHFFDVDAIHAAILAEIDDEIEKYENHGAAFVRFWELVNDEDYDYDDAMIKASLLIE
jgi:hypothetical protein